MTTLKQVLGKGALLLGSLLLIAALLEVGFRVAAARKRAAVRPGSNFGARILPDPDLGYRLRPLPGPGNPEVLYHPSRLPNDGSFRILVLGDSVAYGTGNLVSRIDSLLNRDLKRTRFELINASVPGYTNYQELVYLKKHGAAFQPDLVGVVFVLNDLHKFLHAPEFDETSAPDFLKRSDDAMTSVDNWLFRLGPRVRS
jgi:hypothetical protein